MPPFIHKTVMATELVEAMRPELQGRYVDGTLGGAGHAARLLEGSAPGGWLYGCDQDGAAIEAAQERLKPFEGRFELKQCNFAELSDWIPAGSCDGVMLDLGVSSPQLDVSTRGFSFMRDGPLDMRMDQRQSLTAAQVVNQFEEEDLSRLFWELGEEKMARRFAREIVQQRRVHLFQTTRQLAGLIERLSPQSSRIHPATRVFQALRMRVNDEIGALQRGLEAVWSLLRPGGRLAIITFHSLEARMVKDFGRELARAYDVIGDADIPEFRKEREPKMRWISKKAVMPSEAELNDNPRARSAQLRVMEKV